MRKKIYEMLLDYGPVGRKSRCFGQQGEKGFEILESECLRKKDGKFYWEQYRIGYKDSRGDAIAACEGYK